MLPYPSRKSPYKEFQLVTELSKIKGVLRTSHSPCIREEAEGYREEKLV
jgi:hypothetical protein